MRKKLLFTALLCFGLAGGTAQAQRSVAANPQTFSNHVDHPIPAQRTCGTMDAHGQALEEHPELVSYEEIDNQRYRDFLENFQGQRTTGGPITIPVVVHVIYSSNPNLVSDAQINSQLDVLNEDYGRTNSDTTNTPAAFQGVAANTGIQFCLANQDPQGNASTGILRIQSSLTNHNINNAAQLKALSQWSPYQYLNMWVVESINGGQILGYATFPTNLNAQPNLDGVVMGRTFLGRPSSGAPYNLGRTATHEVGHWLGLRHIWGDGPCSADDQVADTPSSDAANYGCSPNHVSCGSTDMVQNYMDYSDDACMNLFTQGQSDRMNFYLSTERVALQSSQGCAGSTGGGQVTACENDTVNYLLPGTLALYTTNQGGYVSGHNGYGDISKAEFYNNTQGYTKVNGMRLMFGRATAANANSTITAHVWDENGGSPGTVLHTETVNINDIIAATNLVYDITFANAVTVNGGYFVGVTYDYATPGDTVALINNSAGDQTAATAWEQWSDNTWHAYDEQNAWGLAVGNAIHPIINGLTVSVSPSAPTIPNGGSVQLVTNSSLVTATHEWTPATGLSCTTCANPVANPTSTTTYTLTSTDPTANCTTVVDVTVTVGTVGLEDDLFGGEVRAYPNPSNGTFRLEFATGNISDLDILVYNNLGQKLYNERLDSFTGEYSNSIDLSAVPAGIYHLRVTDGERSFQQKLIFK